MFIFRFECTSYTPEFWKSLVEKNLRGEFGRMKYDATEIRMSSYETLERDEIIHEYYDPIGQNAPTNKVGKRKSLQEKPKQHVLKEEAVAYLFDHSKNQWVFFLFLVFVIFGEIFFSFCAIRFEEITRFQNLLKKTNAEIF